MDEILENTVGLAGLKTESTVAFAQLIKSKTTTAIAIFTYPLKIGSLRSISTIPDFGV